MSAEPQVVFFDMDHTLIDNDCDVSWKEFLVEEGLAPRSELDDVYRFYELYVQARLPEGEFNAFQLRQFAGRSPEEMRPLARRHFESRVRSRIFPDAVRAVARHRAAGQAVVLLTATNRVVAEPLAEHLGLDGVIATEIERGDGHYTGRIAGPYCVKEGKVHYAGQHLAGLGLTLADAAYYGDSASDIPMLESVGRPVAVNPAPPLEDLARRRGWPVLRWTLAFPCRKSLD